MDNETSKAKMAKILRIPARGEWEFAEVETEGKGQIALKTMQALVGGYIERVALGGHGLDGLDVFINEEGKLKSLSFNSTATLLTGILMQGDLIVGDAFVCANTSAGHSVGLSDRHELALRRRLRELGV